ncbi:TetR/AcrR family transcriptional regulator [Rhodococcus gannanensis]|uniref:TetR/AcrR family transcriptional regulator n=1 Tax=Rhodococcus gannanensis TaxID=1960308 RepID=A0ABW4P531_9NOCA
MGRKPAITRKAVVTAAVEIIDRDGMEGFSLERVASALGVRAPSLYNHFADRTEILAEVARAIVLETPRIPDPAPGQWREWLIAESLEFRNTLLRHPNLVPVVFAWFPESLLHKLYAQYSDLLGAHGVPASHHLFLLEAAHRMTVGSAVCTATGRPALIELPSGGAAESRERTGSVARDADELLFVDMLRAFLSGVDLGDPD